MIFYGFFLYTETLRTLLQLSLPLYQKRVDEKMKTKQYLFIKNFNISIFLLIFSFLFLGISYTLHAETIKFSTTWGVLTVHSDDGIHYTGTYRKKGGKIYGNYQANTRTFTGIWQKPKSKKMYF